MLPTAAFPVFLAPSTERQQNRAASGLKRGGLFLCLVLAGVASLWAEQSEAYDYAAATVKVAVFGPSDDIFIWWGHAALIIEDKNSRELTYDWGIFDYPGDDFLKAFFQNQVKYRSAESVTRYDMQSYLAEDRDILIYTLDLDEQGKEKIIRYARENVRPENCWYAYDDFKDNCSTRIRDLIDIGTGGQLRAWAEKEQGRFTLRQHVRRFMHFHPWVDWYTGFLIGRMLDESTTVWEEMFLPVELGRAIGDFTFSDANGSARKLVKNITVFNQTKSRQPVLNSPPSITLMSFIAGALIALLGSVALFAGKRPMARIAGGVLQSALGLFFGLSGIAILLAPKLAGNEYLAHNNNILFINPVFLAVIPLGIMEAARKTIRLYRKKTLVPRKALGILWTYMFFAALTALLCNLFPPLRQANISVILFSLPIAFMFSVLPRILFQQNRRKK
jgi:hypothetical protein